MQDPCKLTFSALVALAAGATVATAQPAPPPPSSVFPTEADRRDDSNADADSPVPAPAPAAPRVEPAPPPAPAENVAPFRGTVRDLAEVPYTLGAGDSINVQVFNVPEFSGAFLVGIDGKLRVPLLDPIDVRGLTLDQLTSMLAEQLARTIQRPIVTADLAQPRPIRVSLSGEIVSPGSYTLPSTGTGTITSGDGGTVTTIAFPPLSEVVRGAGGITQAADVRRVRLIRTIGSTPQQLEIDLFDLVTAGNLALDVRLRDGDRIFVPTLQTYNPNEARTLKDSTLVSEASFGPAEVVVVGEVFRPGTQTVGGVTSAEGATQGANTGSNTSRPPTVTAAIQAAGGITNLADLRSISVRRPTRSGEEQIIAANLWKTLVDGDLSQDIIVQPGDTIVVPKAAETLPEEEATIAGASFAPGVINIGVIGEVNNQGRLEVRANTPLSQAILAAGGFARGRARKKVQLVRLNPDGTVTTRKIKADFEAPINSEGNPTLRNNDVVVVGRNTLASVIDTVDIVLSPFTRVFSILNTLDDITDDN
ncbi:MAG: SLBB domain-containing protein [Cyanobacteria bacterium J06641_5]